MSPNVILFWLIHSTTTHRIYRFASHAVCGTSVGRSRGAYRQRPNTMAFIRLSRWATSRGETVRWRLSSVELFHFGPADLGAQDTDVVLSDDQLARCQSFLISISFSVAGGRRSLETATTLDRITDRTLFSSTETPFHRLRLHILDSLSSKNRIRRTSMRILLQYATFCFWSMRRPLDVQASM